MNSDQAGIHHGLRDLGIERGDLVLFHSSFKSLGPVAGGPDRVIDAFLEAVGSAGTVAVPALIHTHGIPRGDRFDPKTAASEVGVLTEFLRKREDAHRSINPTHSVAAVGARAGELTRDHPRAGGGDTPWGSGAFGRGSPWDKLYRWNAKIVLLGVNWDVCTLFHYAQARYVEALQPDYARLIPFPYFTMQRVGKRLEAEGHVTQGKVGEAEVRVCPASILVDRALAYLRESPLELFADQNHPFCTWVKKTSGRSLTMAGGLGCVAILPDRIRDDQGLDSDARVLVLQDSHARVAVVSLPTAYVVRDDARLVRQRVFRETGIPLESILVTCEHRHVPAVDPHGPSGAEHTARLVDAAGGAARQAHERMQPVRIGVAERPVEGVSRIRRVCMSDGKVYSIRRAVPSSWNSAAKPEYAGPDDALDPTLTVLRVEAADRTPIGALFVFSCHPIPDFPHYAAQKAESYFGGDFVCLSLRGSTGNVDVPFEEEIGGKRFNDQLVPLGEILAGALLETIARAQVDDGGSVDVARQSMRLPVDSRAGRESDPEGADACQRMHEAIVAGGFDTETHCVRLGGLALVGVPAESEARFGRVIAAASPFPVTRVVDLANDLVGYVLSPESRAKGGYEADPGLWGVCSGEAEPVMRECAAACLQEMYARLATGPMG